MSDASRAPPLLPRLRRSGVLSILVGLLWATFEVSAAALAGTPRPLLHASLHLTVGFTAAFAAWLLFRAIPPLRRLPDWVAPALAGAGIAGSVTFFRLHLSGLVAVPWLAAPHLRALAIAAAAAAVAGAGLGGLFRALERRASSLLAANGTVAAALLALIVGAHFTGVFLFHPLRVSLDADAGRNSPLPFNVLFVTIDTLRKDHLEPYGYPRPLGAALGDLGFTRFDRFHSTANWTKPTTSSILTGMYPATHSATSTESKLPEEAVTLTELFQEAGAVTGYFPANINASGTFGLDQGADFSIEDPIAPANPLSGTTLGELVRAHWRLTDSSMLNRFALGFLDSAVDRRFFLYVHYNDPHTPYRPPTSYWKQFDGDFQGRVVDDPKLDDPASEREQFHTVARYDGEVARALEAVGKLLDTLERHGVLDDTLVLITADHGEEFREHGKWTHGKTAFDEVLHIPLLVRVPAGFESVPVADVQCNQTDLLPTVCDYLGMTVPERVQGRSLRPFVEGRRETEDPPLLSDSELSEVWSYEKDGLKLIVKTVNGSPRISLYDLNEDPGETRNLARRGRYDEIVATLRNEAEAWRRTLAAESLRSSVTELDEHVRDELRALGYVR